MGLTALGELAKRQAVRYDAGLPLVMVDPSAAAEGLDEAVRRRREGEPFALTVVAPAPFAQAAGRLVPQVLLGESAYDRRRTIFDALSAGKITMDAKPLEAHAPDDPARLLTLADAVRCADVWLGRSWRELAHLEERLGVRHSRPAAAPSTVRRSAGPRPGGQGILVYAPRTPVAELLTVAFGLEEVRAPVTVVCADPENGAQYRVRARFAGPAAAASLEGIGAVVAADPDDPADALAAADWGLPLAVCESSGALEYLWDCTAFGAFDFRSVLVAAQNALGNAAPSRRAWAPGIDELPGWVAAAAPPVAGGPLVSIIVPTKNRPRLLRRLLGSLRAQTYAPVEIIVVNDGGVDVAGVVGDVPGATLVVNPVSTGVAEANRIGLARARGAYAMMIADDDIIYPDHLTRCVAALERTGGAIARPLMVTGYRSLRDGRYVTAGHAVNPPGVDPTDTLLGYSVGSVALVYRIGVLRRFFPDERFGLASDWETMLRIMAEHDVVCIPVPTREQDLRDDNTQIETSGSPAMQVEYRRRLYDAHPAHDRPTTRERREQFLASLAVQGMAPPAPPLRIASPGDAGYAPDDLRA